MPEDSGKLLAEFPAAAAIAVTAFSGALLGTIFGLSVGKRFLSTRNPESEPSLPGGSDGVGMIGWTRLSQLEAELDLTREALHVARRDYELDTGLLKQEIQRLELLLGRFSTGLAAGPTTTTPTSGSSRAGYHSLKLVDPLHTTAARIRFAPLSSLERMPERARESRDA